MKPKHHATLRVLRAVVLPALGGALLGTGCGGTSPPLPPPDSDTPAAVTNDPRTTPGPSPDELRLPYPGEPASPHTPSGDAPPPPEQPLVPGIMPPRGTTAPTVIPTPPGIVPVPPSLIPPPGVVPVTPNLIPPPPPGTTVKPPATIPPPGQPPLPKPGEPIAPNPGFGEAQAAVTVIRRGTRRATNPALTPTRLG
jgi:hypothetical protein